MSNKNKLKRFVIKKIEVNIDPEVLADGWVTRIAFVRRHNMAEHDWRLRSQTRFYRHFSNASLARLHRAQAAMVGLPVTGWPFTR